MRPTLNQEFSFNPKSTVKNNVSAVTHSNLSTAKEITSALWKESNEKPQMSENRNSVESKILGNTDKSLATQKVERLELTSQKKVL
jgi:hypothetical protein